MNKIAVVILNWNGCALMEEFLPSVVANSPEELADVIVADNGSTDNSLQMLSEKFPSVKIIKLDKNYGFAEGYNQALKKIDHKYTVLLNSDVEVSEGWLEAPLQLMENNPEIAGVQPKLLAARNKEYFEYAGAAGGFMDKYGYPYCRGRIFNVIEKDNGQYNDQCDLLWASGACLFIRTEIYKKVGGLDAGFFAHQEEIDMCWRLRSRGYRLVYTSHSVVYHVGGGTLSSENPRKTFLNFRNNLLMLYKNLSEKDLKPVMRIRFFLDYLAATKFLLSGYPKNAKAIYDARKAFKALQPFYAKARNENLEKRVVTDIPELKKDSLLAAFYIKGKKTFNLL